MVSIRGRFLDTADDTSHDSFENALMTSFVASKWNPSAVEESWLPRSLCAGELVPAYHT